MSHLHHHIELCMGRELHLVTRPLGGVVLRCHEDKEHKACLVQRRAAVAVDFLLGNLDVPPAP